MEVFVVLDACTDDSAAIARGFDVSVLQCDARAVGAARRIGVCGALERLRAHRPRRIWLAHTDADSVVPSTWMTQQLELARRGADVIAGRVRPREDDLTAVQIDAWSATHELDGARPEDPLRVYGANLGIRASTYLAAGGFEPIGEHEDVRLVERARSAGARLVVADADPVSTSGRRSGRTPGGFARFLREDLLGSVS